MHDVACEFARAIVRSKDAQKQLARTSLTGPKTYSEIKVSRRVGCVLTSNEVHFVSLADNFTVPFSKLLKLPSLMENKTA